MSNIENSDKKIIKNLYCCINVIIVLCGMALIITGIVYWNKASSGDFYFASNDALSGLGTVFFFGGLLFSVFALMINYVVFGLIFDIKALRNHFVTNQTVTTISSQNETEPLFKNINIESQPPIRTPNAGEWKCPNCGTINKNYVGTCGCGTIKP